ncbi:MAG TPA: hypothetical protein ENK46_03145 [Flavobacteriia bacterium]|nr:hypothetical protein [Flavobacteriia bacterium]
MKKIFQNILMVSMSLFMTSCYYDAYKEEVDIIDPGTNISYKDDIIPLWNQCVGCHNGNQPPDLRDDVSYNDLLNGFVVPGDAEASTLYKSLLGIDNVPLMPPGSQWPDSKIDLVKAWIDQGALNN